MSTKSTKNTARVAEPAPDAVLDGILEPATLPELVRAIVELLGHKTDEIAELQINKKGIIRIFGVDRSARNTRFEWPQPIEETE